jgi:hypothetical protein
MKLDRLAQLAITLIGFGSLPGAGFGFRAAPGGATRQRWLVVWHVHRFSARRHEPLTRRLQRLSNRRKNPAKP